MTQSDTNTNDTERPLVVGATCRHDECDWGPVGTDDPTRSWDIIERMRIDHEDETDHQTRIECLRESRIIPDWADRDSVCEHVLDIADDEIEHVCPECDRVAKPGDSAKRCPDCKKPWRQVLPDGGTDGGVTVQTPPDPFDSDDAMHVDEFPPFNGDDKASFAFDDDGNRFKVWSGNKYPSTKFQPERRWRENWMPERDGVGEDCAGCGEPIEWDAIIVNSECHLRCYVEEEQQQSER